MIQWSIKKLPLELKFPWKISRGISTFKNNYLIEAVCDDYAGHGEVAFNSRYGENESTIERGFERFCAAWDESLDSIHDLSRVMEKLEDLPHSLMFGLESALVHLKSHMEEKTVPSILKASPNYNLKTSFSLPIMDPSRVESFIRSHDLCRFSFLKVKIGHEDGHQVDLDIIRQVAKNFEGPLRVDANEAFASADDAIQFTVALSGFNIEFIEQPLPSRDWEGAKEMFRRSQFPVFADESLESSNVTNTHRQCFHGVNVKLMKSGGYYQAMKQIRAARKLGMKVMLGCMVESSLGILSAMNIAGDVDYFDLDGCLLIRNDPFRLVEEQDGSLMMARLN